MIIRSMYYFPPVTGQRSASASRSIRKVLSGFRSRLWAIVFAAFVMQSVPLLIPFGLQHFLPILMEESDLSQLRMQALANVVALAIIVATVRSLATFYFLKEAGRTGHELVASLRELAFAQIMRLPVRFVERRGAGRILLRFLGDTDALRNWFSKAGPKLVADCLTAVFIFGTLIWLNWMLSLVLVIPLLLTAAIFVSFSRSIREKTGVARGSQARFTGFMQSKLSNIRTSKLEDAVDPARTEFRSHVSEVSWLNAERDRVAAKFEALAQFAASLCLPFLILSGLRLIWSNRLEPSQLIIFLWLTLHLLVLLRSSFSAFVIQQKALVSVQRLYVLLARSAEKGRSARAVNAEFQTLSLVAGGRRYNFSRGLHAVPKGVDTARLLNALHGFEQLSEFKVLIDDTAIERIDLIQRRRLVGRFSPSSSIGNQSAAGAESIDLKVLILEGTLSLLNGLGRRKIAHIAERAIVLYAPSCDDDSTVGVSLASEADTTIDPDRA